jgi:hypothetical protein
LAKESVEEAKTSVRNTRKKALSDLKKLKLPEDDEKFKEKEVHFRSLIPSQTTPPSSQMWAMYE